MAKKILLVEDDTLLSKLFSEALKKEGFEIDISMDGGDGLKKILEGGYDLILLDVMLPVMDGLTILNTIKNKTPNLPNGPILVTTNLANEAILEKALNAGAKDCIDKSKLKTHEIVEKVKSLLP